jgi:hypothetical protein
MPRVNLWSIGTLSACTSVPVTLNQQNLERSIVDGVVPCCLVSSIVILMLDEKMEPAVAKGMLQGEADSLDSAFHLTYNLLLSQMRCQDSTPEDLLQRSYKQFQADRALPDLQVGGRGFWIQDASGVGKVD